MLYSDALQILLNGAKYILSHIYSYNHINIDRVKIKKVAFNIRRTAAVPQAQQQLRFDYFPPDLPGNCISVNTTDRRRSSYKSATLHTYVPLRK